MRDCLEAKYSLPHHVFLWEVRNSTGFDSTRSCDALALSLYVSRGHALTGFEIKEHRSDWLSELKKPDKAEAIAQFCDFFFLVTSDQKIAKLEEIPIPWGWLAFTGARFKVMKKAEQIKSRPLDRAMVCSLVYATMQRFTNESRKLLEEAVEKEVQSRHRVITYERDEAQERYRALKDSMNEFEKHSGLNLRWTCTEEIPKIGAAVKRVLNEKDVLADFRRDLVWAKNHAERLVAAITAELAEVGDPENSPTDTPTL